MQNVKSIYADNVQVQMDKADINSTICWFCDKIDTEDDKTEIYLQKLLNTNIGLTGNKYEYLVLSRRIPCCRTCRRTHENARKWSSNLMTLGGIAGLVAGLILPFVIFLNLQITPGKNFNTIVICAIFGGIVSGVILGYLLGRKIAFAFAPDTKPETYAGQHPLIEPLMSEGWRIGKPE